MTVIYIAFASIAVAVVQIHSVPAQALFLFLAMLLMQSVVSQILEKNVARVAELEKKLDMCLERIQADFWEHDARMVESIQDDVKARIDILEDLIHSQNRENKNLIYKIAQWCVEINVKVHLLIENTFQAENLKQVYVWLGGWRPQRATSALG